MVHVHVNHDDMLTTLHMVAVNDVMVRVSGLYRLAAFGCIFSFLRGCQILGPRRTHADIAGPVKVRALPVRANQPGQILALSHRLADFNGVFYGHAVLRVWRFMRWGI